MQELKLWLENEDKTLEIANRLALCLQNFSDVRTILLFGEMGAGKTTFTRGFVSAFSGYANAEVSSPTFALVNRYPTEPTIYHADIYRLAEMYPTDIVNNIFPDIPEELEEVLDDGNVFKVIEWAEYIDPNLLPKQRLDIFLKIDNNRRSIILKADKELIDYFKSYNLT